MSLYRRGRTWWIELYPPSGRHRESAGTSDRKAAQEFHEKRKSDLWRRDRLGEPSVTWGEAVKKWLTLKPRGLPDRYRIRKLRIDPTTALPLSKQQAEDALHRALSKPSSGSWNRTRAVILAIHAASGTRTPEIEHRQMPAGRTRWLTAEEWKRLKKHLHTASPLLAQAAEFTLATGLRENNVLELAWDQTDLRRRVAWLHGDQMKAGVALGIPLNGAACAILAARRGIDKRWVFGNPDHPLSRASNRAWREARAGAKLDDFRWHDLRHTWASWSVMSGVRLEELQRLGGWKTLQMVQRYAHLAPEHLAEVAGKIRPISLRYNARKRVARRTNTPTNGLLAQR